MLMNRSPLSTAEYSGGDESESVLRLVRTSINMHTHTAENVWSVTILLIIFSLPIPGFLFLLEDA